LTGETGAKSVRARDTIIDRVQQDDGTWCVTGTRPTTDTVCICGALVPRVEQVTSWDTKTGTITRWGCPTGTCPECGTVLIDSLVLGRRALPKDRTTWRRVRREREREPEREARESC
jgi:hypothetical protein